MKIAHLADLHLGFRAYHRVTPRGVNVREADVADAFRRAVARTVALRPDLVIVAGDVFHTVRPSNASIAEAFRQLSVLCEGLRGVPVVMVAGNHDSPRSADTGNILSLFREIPGVVVVADECRPVHLPQCEATVLCMPHNAMAVHMETEMEPDPKARHNVLAIHGTIAGKSAEEKIRYVSEYGGATVAESAIGPERWSYVALGHYHIRTELAPNMWYAGGIERTSTNVWMEREPKGFLLHDTETGETAFEALETREMVDIPRLSARGRTSAEVDEAIRAAVEGVPGGIAGKLVRMVVEDIPRAMVRELNHRRIRDWKADALHFHLDARPPEVRRRSGSGAPTRRQSLGEQVESYLQSHWSLTTGGLERTRLVELGKAYMRMTEEG